MLLLKFVREKEINNKKYWEQCVHDDKTPNWNLKSPQQANRKIKWQVLSIIQEVMSIEKKKEKIIQ